MRKKFSCDSIHEILGKLFQETDIVLKKHLDVVDAVLEHGQAVDADAESKATDFLRIIVHKAIYGGIDHAGTEEFDPAGAFALAAGSATFRGAAAAAENAGGVELHRWFGEGKITWAKAGLHRFAEELLHEVVDGAGEIAEGDVGIDCQAFDLMKHERMRRVGVVAAVDLAGGDDSNGRLTLFHCANLHR